MDGRIKGIHHITAIAGDAQLNYDFYTKTLGLRMVKKTVNFDDPQTYHFYFGDEIGTPGTIITFFPWPNVRQGVNGAGMATEIGYSVPEGSIEFWANRFQSLGIKFERRTRFGESALIFADPDGLRLSITEPTLQDTRSGWTKGEIPAEHAIKGFHSVTLTLHGVKETASVLTDIFRYELEEQEGIYYRYRTDAAGGAAIVDLQEVPDAPRGLNSRGTNHHVAFRVESEEILMQFREKVLARGMHITEKINRDYFFSLYFREPGGVLFEIATDNPGFATDESVENLGSSLRLPGRYEPYRSKIEASLPVLITA